MFVPRDNYQKVDRIPVKGTRRYYNEYAFFQVMDQLNASLPAAQRLTMSRIRQIRVAIDESLKARGQVSLAAAKDTAAVVYGLEDVLASVPEAKDFRERLIGREAEMAAPIMAEYKRMIGVGEDRGVYPAPVLPLSPYDPRYMNRSAFIENGHQILYAYGGSIMNELATKRNPESEMTSVNHDEVMNERLELYRLDPERGDFRQAGVAMSLDDRCGASALRPFMSEAEWKAIHQPYNGKPWCAAGEDKDKNPVYMSNEAINRVHDVVAALRYEGINFTVMPDRHPGQVKLRIGSMDFRVVDPYAEQFAGARVYDDGATYSYQVEGHMIPDDDPRKGGSKKSYISVAPQTTQQAVDLVKFAMGEALRQPDGKLVGLPDIENKTTRGQYGRTNSKRQHKAYHSNGNFRVTVAETSIDGGRTGNMSIFCSVERSPSHTIFKEKAVSDQFLFDAVSSARERFMSELSVDTLVQAAKDHADEPDFMPVLSNNPDIMAVQRKYWDLLTDKDGSVELLKPGVEAKEFTDAVHHMTDEEKAAMAYTTGTAEDRIRAHMADLTDEFIGTYEPVAGKRFNPVNVGMYMSSPYGRFRNNDDLVAAMRMSDIQPEELRGDDFYVDVMASQLVKYDEKSSVQMSKHPDPFIREMFQVVKESLQSNACRVEDKDIRIDANGIVHYEVQRASAQGASDKSMQPVVGEIGQILAPDANGVVEARDHYFVPGYEADILPNRPGEHKPYEERMVLSDYTSVLKREIRSTIRNDLLETRPDVGVPTSLNKVVRHLYDTRYDKDFYERTEKDGMSSELRDAIIKTNRARVKLSSRFMKDANRSAVYRANRAIAGSQQNAANDIKMDPVTITEGRNVAIMEEPGDGMFDPKMTGNGNSQGVRYLVEGAKVVDGRIVPSEDKDDRCALTRYLQKTGRMPDFDAVDRSCMTINGLLHGLRETEPVGMAQMSFGCFTLEDGIVVSKKFAEENMVRDTEGEFRPLATGDKMECHGNKGVISIVIDPDMPDEEAEKLGLLKAVQTFRENPDLDVVMSPYSGVSRFNAGMAREAMARETNGLSVPGHGIVPGAIGKVTFTILEQTGDSKSHYSDDGTQKRSWGAQYGWASAANDCSEVIKEGFRDNSKAAAALREYLITEGMDLDPTGRMLIGYHPQDGEERRVYGMSAPPTREVNRKGTMKTEVDKAEAQRRFGDWLAQSGGFLEVPFALKYPGDLPGKAGTLEKLPDGQRTDESKAYYPHNTYRFPIMSAYLRSGQEFVDGESMTHDYTKHYLNIYKAALSYTETAAKFREEMSEPEKEELREEMRKQKSVAQAEFDKITSDIDEKRFSGKHNIFRTGIMANKQAQSATAVISPDGRLGVDEIGMNPDMARTIGVQDGGWVVLHRDPVLQGSGIRYMKVKYDDRLNGISVNPAGIPKGMDMDFDGDCGGVKAFSGRAVEAKKEAMEKLSVKANLLNKGAKNEETGEYELFISGGQDISAAHSARPELKETYAALRTEVNAFEREYAEGKLNAQQVDKKRREATDRISTYLKDCADASFGVHVISFASPEAHIKSMERYVDDGAKGSLGKVKTYAQFAGIEYETTEDGHLKEGTAVMRDESLATREQHVGILKAKNMQQQYTGFAGSFSIRAMRVLMNKNPNDATMLTKLATQGVLQVKHDAHMADVYEQVLTGPARDIWRGYKLKPSMTYVRETTPVKMPDGSTVMGVSMKAMDTWDRVTDEKGKPVMATREEFVQQFMEVYGSKERGMGLDVNREIVERIAKDLSDPATGIMRDLETDLVEEYAAPLQMLAYADSSREDGPKLLREMALKMTNDPNYPGLFETKGNVTKNYNRCMADAAVVGVNLDIKARNAAGADEVDYVPEGYKHLGKSDVLVDGRVKERKAVVLGQAAVTVKTPVNRTGNDLPDIGDDDAGIEDEASKKQGGGNGDGETMSF